MQKRILCLTVLIFCSLQFCANAAESDFQNWSLITLDHSITDKYGYYLELQNRVDNNWSDQSLFILRPAFRYKLNDHVKLYQGYDWFTTYRDEFRSEHRLWQQIEWSKQYDHYKHFAWLRLEERFLEDADTALRARLRLGVAIPLAKDYKWSLELFEESFVHLYSVSNGPEAGFDQNWFYAGLAHKLNDNAKLSVGYILNLLAREPDNQIQHGIRAMLSFRI